MPQSRGTCGHRKAEWDDHANCLSCAKCTKDDGCPMCCLWTDEVWDLAVKRREHKSRKRSDISDSSPDRKSKKKKRGGRTMSQSRDSSADSQSGTASQSASPDRLPPSGIVDGNRVQSATGHAPSSRALDSHRGHDSPGGFSKSLPTTGPPGQVAGQPGITGSDRATGLTRSWNQTGYTGFSTGQDVTSSHGEQGRDFRPLSAAGQDRVAHTARDRPLQTGTDRALGTGLDRTPGIPGTGFDRAPGTGFDRAPGTGYDRAPSTGYDRAPPGTGYDRTPGSDYDWGTGLGGFGPQPDQFSQRAPAPYGWQYPPYPYWGGPPRSSQADGRDWGWNYPPSIPRSHGPPTATAPCPPSPPPRDPPTSPVRSTRDRSPSPCPDAISIAVSDNEFDREEETISPPPASDRAVRRTSGTPSISSSSSVKEDQEGWTFDRAIKEVYRLLPEEMCPPPKRKTNKILSSLEILSGTDTSNPLLLLPHSAVVASVADKFQEEFDSARGAKAWQVPQSTLRQLSSPGSYKVHDPSWPLKPPPLDATASKVGLTTPSNVNVTWKAMEGLDAKARQLVSIASHADLFSAASYLSLKEQELDPAALERLLEAVARTTRHSVAVAMALSTELLQLRRDAVLDSSSFLLPHNKDKLRGSPLASPTMFGESLQGIAAADMTDRQHMVLSKASQPKREQPPKRANPAAPSGAPATKQPRFKSPRPPGRQVQGRQPRQGNKGQGWPRQKGPSSSPSPQAPPKGPQKP